MYRSLSIGISLCSVHDELTSFYLVNPNTNNYTIVQCVFEKKTCAWDF